MAGTNKFLQWNPTQANQETDDQYAADVQRSGGAVSGIFPSATANKLFFQTTTMCAAIAQTLADKGYDVNDSNLTNLKKLITFITANPYAILQLTGTLTLAYATLQPIVFDTILHDDIGFANLSHPTRLTVPAGSGIKRVQITGNSHLVNATSNTGDCVMGLTKNGAFFAPAPSNRKVMGANGQVDFNIASCILEVNEGDYFELPVYHAIAATSLSVGVDPNINWFAIRAIG